MTSEHLDAEPVATFVDVFTRLAGHAHRASGPSDVAPILRAILDEHPVSTVAVAGLTQELLSVAREVCSERGVELLESPFSDMPLPDTVDRAGVGVTMATFAVAETGSVVETTRQDADRLVSSLPRVHICFVLRDSIVPTLPEAASRMRDAFDPEGANTVTFISGPSRTGDIEMKLTLGVHGPEVMHVVVLN